MRSIAFFALLGVAMNLALAWALAIAYDFEWIGKPVQSPATCALIWPIETPPWFAATPDRAEELRAFGVSGVGFQGLTRDGATRRDDPDDYYGSFYFNATGVSRMSFGVPFRSMSRDQLDPNLQFRLGEGSFPPETWRLDEGLVIARHVPSDAARASLPLNPLWGGFAVNSLVFAIVAAAATRLHKVVRAFRGTCPTCGYSLIGANGKLCPECGGSARGPKRTA